MNTITNAPATNADMPTAKPAEKHLTSEQVEQLQRLTKVAKQARGSYYSKEVADASCSLSALLNEYLQEGVRYRELSEATGLKWRSIKARLFRHGYLDTVPPSQQNKVFQGPKQPGPKCDHDPSRWRDRMNRETGKVVHTECLECRKNKRIKKKQEAESLRLAS